MTDFGSLNQAKIQIEEMVSQLLQGETISEYKYKIY